MYQQIPELRHRRTSCLDNVPYCSGSAGAGSKVFTLQTLPACDVEEPFSGAADQVTGYSLHTGVAARANEREKLERLCRYISRPAISEKRLSLTSNGDIRYPLKTRIEMALPTSSSSHWISWHGLPSWCPSPESI
jgi:hypothetical protein